MNRVGKRYTLLRKETSRTHAQVKISKKSTNFEITTVVIYPSGMPPPHTKHPISASYAQTTGPRVIGTGGWARGYCCVVSQSVIGRSHILWCGTTSPIHHWLYIERTATFPGRFSFNNHLIPITYRTPQSTNSSSLVCSRVGQRVLPPSMLVMGRLWWISFLSIPDVPWSEFWVQLVPVVVVVLLVPPELQF